MIEVSCSSGMFPTDGGRCCPLCPPGTFVKSNCNATAGTQCEACAHGSYTATSNYGISCLVCRACSSDEKRRPAEPCTATKNTVCECQAGYFCGNSNCDYCHLVTHCPEGEGVKVAATRTSDTVCAPCGPGTYSNVSDFLSPCETHTRCENIGKKLKFPGTNRIDATCSEVACDCSWILPAGLWSGLVLTILVLLAIAICWRLKRRRTYRTVQKLNGLHQEGGAEEDCKLPLFQTDGDEDTCTRDSLPIEPLKDFSLPIPGHCVSNFLRTTSEPQEDEWCET